MHNETIETMQRSPEEHPGSCWAFSGKTRTVLSQMEQGADKSKGSRISYFPSTLPRLGG